MHSPFLFFLALFRALALVYCSRILDHVHTLADADALSQLFNQRISVILGDVFGPPAAKSLCAGATQASSVPNWISTLEPSGKWPDSQIDYTAGCSAQRSNWPAQCHWQRICKYSALRCVVELTSSSSSVFALTVTLAASWHGPLPGATQYQNSSKVLNAVSRAMDWWFDRDFVNPRCLDSGNTPACPCNSTGFWNTNWFANVDGLPTLVAQACLLIGPNLSPVQLSNCSNIGLRAYGTFDHTVNGLGVLTGANTLDVANIGVDIGLLNSNVSMLQDAYGRAHREVVVQNGTSADGIRPDGSFGQHSGLMYNGNYGKDYMNDVLKLETTAMGSTYEANETSKSALLLLTEGYSWMTYLNTLTHVQHWDLSSLARFISFPVADMQATAGLSTNVSRLQALGNAWNASTLITTATQLENIVGTVNEAGPQGNRGFWNNDYMVHRESNYVTTVKGYSQRSQNTECVNSQNRLGFHLSDGALFTYVTGNEYEDIAASWDWNLIPGITVDYNATPLSCEHAGWTGLESFVGGASTGSIGAFAMRFTNPFTRQLKWQKSWLFFRNRLQYITVSNISSNSVAPILSVLDQKKHSGGVFVDGQSLTSGKNFSSFNSLWHDNVGYFFRGPAAANTSLCVTIASREGSWSSIGSSQQPNETVNIFAAWLHHYATNNPVSYTAHPGINYADFLALQRQNDLLILANDGATVAALDTSHNDLIAVFWESSGGNVSIPLLVVWNEGPDGKVAIPIFSEQFRYIVTCRQAAIVIISQEDWSITVSDPSQMLTKIDLVLDVSPGAMVPDALPWANEAPKTLSFNLPTGGLAGQSVRQSLLV